MVNKKRDEVVDTIRTIYWFRHLTICLGAGSPLEVRRLIEPDREATDIHGEAVRSAKYHLYHAGEHVPNRKMIDQAEQAASGTALIIEHVLWEIVRAPLQQLGKAATQMLRQLSPDIQELILAPNNQIRLSGAHHYLRALERRRSLDGLAALTLLLRLSLERHDQLLAKEYACSLLKVLLMLGLDLIAHGVADLIFDLYVERLFRQVRWDGLRLDLANYPYPIVAVKLHATIENRLMLARLSGSHETRDQIATGILAGHYAQHLYPLIEPRVVPDLDIGPPASDTSAIGQVHCTSNV